MAEVRTSLSKETLCRGKRDLLETYGESRASKAIAWLRYAKMSKETYYQLRSAQVSMYIHVCVCVLCVCACRCIERDIDRHTTEGR
jgi:hypothetical protein